MWLLDTSSYRLVEINETRKPDYAILSHTWGAEEVTFRDIDQQKDISSKAGYRKVSFACEQALRDGYKYVWVDTCCIDKSSSAELSEAINSMWKYYSRSAVCYALLDDVPGIAFDSSVGDGTNAELTPDSGMHELVRKLEVSRWFQRGWTLQETLAPEKLEFYGSDGGFMGTRASMADLLSRITGIPVNPLTSARRFLPQYSVAQRMSWWNDRKTTKPEDRAYALLGLFNVNIPLLYGEGGRRAFRRLQEEIIKYSTDHSIFAWSKQLTRPGLPTDLPIARSYLLAPTPAWFASSGDVVAPSARLPTEPYEMTNRGLRITLQVCELEPLGKGDSAAMLNCTMQGKPVYLRLHEDPNHAAEGVARQFQLDRRVLDWEPRTMAPESMSRKTIIILAEPL
jgi:hypothetical protein